MNVFIPKIPIIDWNGNGRLFDPDDIAVTLAIAETLEELQEREEEDD